MNTPNGKAEIEVHANDVDAMKRKGFTKADEKPAAAANKSRRGGRGDATSESEVN